MPYTIKEQAQLIRMVGIFIYERGKCVEEGYFPVLSELEFQTNLTNTGIENNRNIGGMRYED